MLAEALAENTTLRSLDIALSGIGSAQSIGQSHGPKKARSKQKKEKFVKMKIEKTMFKRKSKIRLRPSYFPFTEPSAEVDVYWGLNNETDYKMTKGTGWLEIMGCGMVDPNVLKNCKIDPNEYSGFAFGLGIDRIALLLHQIDHIRLLSENDIRFLEQFKASF